MTNKNYSPISTPKEVIRLTFNYKPRIFDGYQELSESYEERSVGYNHVVSIHEKQAMGEGDKWFYDILYDNNHVERIFNPHQVFFKITEP